MLYGYYIKLIKEYENILLWIHKTFEYRVNIFEKKCVSVLVTSSATYIFPTENSVTAYVPTANSVTASVTTTNTVTASVTTYNITAVSDPTDNFVTASV